MFKAKLEIIAPNGFCLLSWLVFCGFGVGGLGGCAPAPRLTPNADGPRMDTEDVGNSYSGPLLAAGLRC